VKSNPLKFVKSDKALKASWGALRRQIVPKIGQLTNDPNAISRIVRLFCVGYTERTNHLFIAVTAAD
jgi:hypothetical protein